ncbi:MAG: DUF3784 domain-containing protein [Algoriphagus sp.]|uniref:DUF3784 domain-containing protein n=1 Tax=Algoriphagus sp. TaxID=1872435 RepID=UPI00262001C0|nr:DUF3784 domain-containing protein [Algoriphagus sp.]MDG1276065.1 DUF3784 domain-containing protein [Algoriphagus sp.]
METIILGLILITSALLLKFFPNLLAGYSQLSQGEKENALKNGLPTFAFTVFSVMGLLVIGGYFLSIWQDNPPLSSSINIAVILTGAVVMIVFGKILINRRTN